MCPWVVHASRHERAWTAALRCGGSVHRRPQGRRTCNIQYARNDPTLWAPPLAKEPDELYLIHQLFAARTRASARVAPGC